MYRRILVPTDGSELSIAAERAAIDFARANGSAIVALAVGQPYLPTAAVDGAVAIDPAIEAETLLLEANRHVERVAAAARAAGVACTAVTTIAHSASQAILEHAAKHGCDLIFMATHGRRGLTRLLLGSVTQDVLAASTVPVLVLRPQDAAAPA
ncbi:universal stress protein [Massilia sp. YIM B02763]|uniref:universal stress protein n=1 Tax=Massilia sp. YIM B02763 TaxID=3050130 RepID=UPI0025B70832|nr:universal stress protein [Massilia sp. YIM B02763]MDN4051501.1 universal stress protein [Massilia sp. YIM B02763]